MFEGTSSTSKQRYWKRIDSFQGEFKSRFKLRHYFWWVVHNLFAHLFLLIPCDLSFAFHDYTSARINSPKKFKPFRTFLNQIRNDGNLRKTYREVWNQQNKIIEILGPPFKIFRSLNRGIDLFYLTETKKIKNETYYLNLTVSWDLHKKEITLDGYHYQYRNGEKKFFAHSSLDRLKTDFESIKRKLLQSYNECNPEKSVSSSTEDTPSTHNSSEGPSDETMR